MREWKEEDREEEKISTSIPRKISWTGLNIANRIKYIYYSFTVTKLQKSKEKSLNLKSYINRIFTPEREIKIFGKSPKRRNKA